METNKLRMLVLHSMLQQAFINLHTTYDHSSLHGSGEIFEPKFQYSMSGKKEIEEIQGRISRRCWLSIPQYSKSTSTYISNMTILACMVAKFHYSKNGKKDNSTPQQPACQIRPF